MLQQQKAHPRGQSHQPDVLQKTFYYNVLHIIITSVAHKGLTLKLLLWTIKNCEKTKTWKEIGARGVKHAAGTKSDSTESINAQLECPGSRLSVFFLVPCHFPAAINWCLTEKYKIHMIANYTSPYPHGRVLFSFTKLVGCLCPKYGIVFCTFLLLNIYTNVLVSIINSKGKE